MCRVSAGELGVFHFATGDPGSHAGVSGHHNPQSGWGARPLQRAEASGPRAQPTAAPAARRLVSASLIHLTPPSRTVSARLQCFWWYSSFIVQSCDFFDSLMLYWLLYFLRAVLVNFDYNYLDWVDQLTFSRFHSVNLIEFPFSLNVHHHVPCLPFFSSIGLTCSTLS